MARFVRSTGIVPQFADYTHYKPYLRRDFEFRCAYCEMTEACVFGIQTFGIDHFRPKKLFPHLLCDYQNLYYCCNDCNRYKGPVWPSDERIAEGHFFPDPCQCDPRVEHLRESEDATLAPITKAGEFSLEVLRLNREPCLRFRRKRCAIQQRIQHYRKALAATTPHEIRDLLLEAISELQRECSDIYGFSF